MRKAGPTEAQIQSALFEHFRLRAAPGVMAWHTPNEGLRSLAAGRRLKAHGMLRGVSDILALKNGRFFALEVKRDGARPTEDQLHYIQRVQDCGGFATWAAGLDRCLRVLCAWELLSPSVLDQHRVG